MSVPVDRPTPAPVATPHLFRGRWVVLVVLLAAPLVIIPLLLTGPGTTRQLCLATLAQREKTAWTIGYMALGDAPWQVVDEWPDKVGLLALAESRAPLPGLTPLEAARLAWPQEDLAEVHLWVTVERTMPFAFFVQIRNRDALNPGHADLFAVRRVAAGVLDPTDPADADCLVRLTDALLQGQETASTPEGRVFAPARRIRNRTPTAGERLARDLFNPLTAALDDPDPHDALRVVLCP